MYDKYAYYHLFESITKIIEELHCIQVNAEILRREGKLVESEKDQNGSK